jgi:Cupin superfamily protein
MSRLIEIDAAEFADAFAMRSIAVQHALVDHPLFTLDAIADLADRLPPASVRRERGDLSLTNVGGYVDVGEGRPSAAVRGIESNGFRVTLRNIQQAPEYAKLIDMCLDEVEPLIGDREGGMRRRAGYLFISAPAATTPMHYDVEHSFLLQVRGVKHVSSVAFDDEPELRRRELERHGDGAAADFAAMQQAAARFRLDPGVGVYLPSFVPHWVETEAGVSVSFSIPFFTEFCERADAVYRINARLRRLGLSPQPPGASESRDKLKAAVARSLLKIRETRHKLPA